MDSVLQCLFFSVKDFLFSHPETAWFPVRCLRPERPDAGPTAPRTAQGQTSDNKMEWERTTAKERGWARSGQSPPKEEGKSKGRPVVFVLETIRTSAMCVIHVSL